ncbi:MAG: ABC transporter ATP-binding protein [Anaerolineae bacterium]
MIANDKFKAEHVSKVFQDKSGKSVQALADVNLEVREGEFLCLVGPSGCGKTTFLRIVAGLETPSSGQVLMEGQPIAGPDPERGMVFQEFALFPWRTVLGNVEFGLEIQGVEAKARREMVMRYINLTGLGGFEHSYPHQLSGGMKQRAAIARVLANDPKIILMDEPFGSLDAQTRNLMQAELLDIWQKERKTILFVTHNVDEAVFLADRIAVMSRRPGYILEVVLVDLPRPRVRTSSEFNAIREHILYLLTREIALERGS